MTEPVFTTDGAVQMFETVDQDGVTADSDDTTIQWSETPIVEVDVPAELRGAFDTSRFYKIADATVARPIKQEYRVGDDTKVFKKPAEELREAAWSFDNAPYTLGHPSTGMVKDVDDVHGFWRNPYYDSDSERLLSDLYVPVTDDDALSFIEDNTDVSVGFFNRVYSEYDGDTGTLSDEEGVDGYQTDIYGNHIAGVTVGRCSSDDGCGLDHGTVTTDGTTSFLTKEDQTEPDDDDDEPDALVRRLERRRDQEDALDLSVPEAAQSNAQDYLDAKSDGLVPDDCGGEDDLADRRAQQFADGGELSLETWVTGDTSAVANWHPRHEGNEDYDESKVETPWEDCGYATHKAWGGDAAKEKAARLKKQYNEMQDSMDMYNQGTVVSWQGGSARGEIIDSTTGGCFNERIDGDVEVCGTEDEPAYLIEEDDGATVAHKHSTLTVETSDSRDYVIAPPSADYESDGEYYAIAPDETDDDQPKYPINSCSDVQDAWHLRAHGDYMIDQSTLEQRIKDRADELDCDMPGSDMDSDCPSCPNMDDNFDIPDLSIDALAEKNSQVKELRDERDQYASAVDSMRDTLEIADDACPAEAIGDVVESRDALQDTLDAVRDAFDIDDNTDVVDAVEDFAEEWSEFRADKRETKLDRLDELGADRDEWADASLDELDEEIERREEVIDAVSDVSPTRVTGSQDTDTDVDRTPKGTRTYGRGYGSE